MTQHPEGRQTCLATYLDGQHVLTSAYCCTAPDPMMPLGDLTHGQVWDDINNDHVSHCTGSATIVGDMARIEGNYCIIYLTFWPPLLTPILIDVVLLLRALC